MLQVNNVERDNARGDLAVCVGPFDGDAQSEDLFEERGFSQGAPLVGGAWSARKEKRHGVRIDPDGEFPNGGQVRAVQSVGDAQDPRQARYPGAIVS